MSVELNPSVKANLINHLMHLEDNKKFPMMKLGNTEQLASAVKFTSCEKISRCFTRDESSFRNEAPHKYPELSNRCCLVACIDRFLDVQVIAVYTLEQMKDIYAQRRGGGVNSFEWRILEVPEEIAIELLNSIKAETGPENEMHLTITDFVGEKKSTNPVGNQEKPITVNELEAELMEMIEESAKEKDFKRALELAEGISDAGFREQTIRSLQQRQNK